MRKKLKELRIKKGYKTHKEFSDAIGVSICTYKNIEYGNRFPREQLLFKILEKLETSDLSIMQDSIKNYKRGDVNIKVCELMNEQSIREFSTYDIYALRKSINKELKDRKDKGIKVKYNDDGKRLIQRRAAIIANEEYNLNITHNEIKLFKECVREEYQRRTGKSTWSIPQARESLGYDPLTGKKKRKKVSV
jgi:transcriptional regulator with XRE-family HTH domain